MTKRSVSLMSLMEYLKGEARSGIGTVVWVTVLVATGLVAVWKVV